MLEPPADVDQGHDGVAQAQEIAAQHVERSISAWLERGRKHAVLDRVDLRLDRLDHRHVVVDDEVEDGVEDVVLAVREHAGQASQRSRTGV